MSSFTALGRGGPLIRKLHFAALLALGALALLPAAAPANPHWSSNGALIAGGQKVPVVSWGTLNAMESKGAGEGAVTCHYVGGGYVSNPGTGNEGPPGEGATQEFASYECAANVPCEPGHGQTLAVPKSLPWPSRLETREGIRVESTGVEIELGCTEPPEFNKIAGATFVARPGAPLAPLAPAGTNKGTSAANPGQMAFDEKMSEIDGPEPVYAKLRFIGTLKTLGYEEQELIQAKPGAAEIETERVAASSTEIKGDLRCHFSKKGDTCVIRTTNVGTVAAEILERAITPNEANFKLIKLECAPGLLLHVKPTAPFMCEDTIELIQSPTKYNQFVAEYVVGGKESGGPGTVTNSVQLVAK